MRSVHEQGDRWEVEKKSNMKEGKRREKYMRWVQMSDGGNTQVQERGTAIQFPHVQIKRAEFSEGDYPVSNTVATNHDQSVLHLPSYFWLIFMSSI